MLIISATVVLTSLTPPSSAPAALPAPVVDVPGPLTSLTVTQAGSKLGNTPLSPDLNFSCPKSKLGVADTKNTAELIKNTTKPLINSKNTTEPVTDSNENAISNASSKPQPISAPKPLRIILPNPLSVLALAAAKVDIPPSLLAELNPSPPLKSHGPGDPPQEGHAGLNVKKENMSKTSGKGKMRPSPKQNGWNLYVHHWLKQIKTKRTTDKFCIHYGSLDKEQRKICALVPYV
ncbi:hypothetical protein BDR05DRAFT_1002810 [Suillus weaverae]|nr:hypothetical protein BDR05DRAFT_1002810 [Suillus weaverae]